MTKQSVLFSILSIAVFCVAAFAAGDFNGNWTAAIDTQIGVQNYVFTFKVEGEKVTGKAKSELAMTTTDLTEGAVKGDDISFVENLDFQGMPLRITYKGKISGDEIKFTRNVADIGEETFVAKRSK